jgi:hypothetical protein
MIASLRSRVPLHVVGLMVLTLLSGLARADSPPTGWDSRDIGAVGQPGSASGTGSAMTISGSGSDIWGTADAFHFVSAFSGTLGTTASIQARVTSEQFTNAFAKAGLMVRHSYSADAAHVLLDVKPDGGIELMTRQADGAATTFVAGATAVFPVWLKLSYDANGATGQISSDGTTWTTVGTVAFPNANVGITGLAVTSHDDSVLNQSNFDNVQFEAASTAALPDRWVQTNVGATRDPGNASYANGTFTVTGDGSDIWGTSDSFHFVYRQAGGGFDTQLTAHLTSLQNTNAFAKAGIMIRESLAADAGSVVLDVKPDGGVEFMARTTAGGATSFIGGMSQPAPAWLRLIRRSNVVSGYVSADDQNWTKVGEIAAPWPDDVNDVGMAVTSHDSTAVNTATFDNVTGYFSQDIGDVGVSGAIAEDHNQVTIRGAGADIWGTADAFHYVSVPFTNARFHSMTVRIRSLENTNPFAKAGIMLRDSMDPASAQVIVDIKPDGSVEFMKRSAAGEETTFIAGASLSLPTWLQLQYDSATQTATAYAIPNPSDRSSWIQLGPTPIALSPTGSIGFAVTSHDRNTLTTAVFDPPTIDN